MMGASGNMEGADDASGRAVLRPYIPSFGARSRARLEVMTWLLLARRRRKDRKKSACGAKVG